jgi:hypothetical protein
VFHIIRLLLIVAVIVLAVIWYRGRDRRALRGLAGAAGALAVLSLIDMLTRFFGGETDQEQIVRKIREMAAGVQARDLERTFQHVSDSFERSGVTKSMLRQTAQSAIDGNEVTEIRVWTFDPAQITPAKDGQPATATIRFPFKVVTSDGEAPPFHCEAVFVKDPDGQWRLKSFQVFLHGSKNPYPIPHLDH